MRKKINQKLLILLLIIISDLGVVSGQSNSLKALSLYLTTYKDKHRIILTTIENNNTLTINQKLVLYETEMNKLKEEFRLIRNSEYQTINIEKSISHSCTNGVTGVVKDCGIVYVKAPTDDLYTQKSWLRVVGTDKGTTVSADGSTAGLKMTVAGRNRNSGTLYATFRYRPERLSTLVETDTENLFKAITNTNVSSPGNRRIILPHIKEKIFPVKKDTLVKN